MIFHKFQPTISVAQTLSMIRTPTHMALNCQAIGTRPLAISAPYIPSFQLKVACKIAAPHLCNNFLITLLPQTFIGFAQLWFFGKSILDTYPPEPLPRP